MSKIYDGNGNEVKFYMPNLLVNGDFQVNQRGKSSYSNYGYTFDMWKLWVGVEGGTLAVNENSITLNGHSNIHQYVNLKQGKEYIAIAKINGQIKTMKFTCGTNKTYEELEAYNETDGRLRIIINCALGSTLDVEYIDLFEGSFAYPHVKEDYAIALMRCQRYLNFIKYNTTLSIGYVRNNNTLRFVIKNPIEMAAEPKVKIGGYISFETEDFNYYELKNPTIVQSARQYICLEFTLEKICTVGKVGSIFLEETDGKYIEISCEPQ